MPVSRFAGLAGIPERTYWHRLSRMRSGSVVKGPWPSPAVDLIEAVAAKYATDRPAWGHRKIAAMMRINGSAALGLLASHLRDARLPNPLDRSMRKITTVSA